MSYHLLKLKNLNVLKQQNQILTFDHLIIGVTPSSLLDAALNQKNNCLWDITDRSLLEHLQIADNLPYPWFVSKFKNVDISNVTSSPEALFYKDGEFRNFQGRHRLGNCHDFLHLHQGPLLNFSWGSWWSEKLSPQIREKLEKDHYQGQIKSLDFVDGVWVLTTFDQREIRSKTIAWNLSPELFLKTCKMSSTYTKDFLEFTENLKPLNLFLLEVKLAKPLTLPSTTRVLLPLTMGTDEGYFLLSSTQNECRYNLLFPWANDDISEEEVANKIKQIKKQLKKIFIADSPSFIEEKFFFLPNYTFISSTSKNISTENPWQKDPIFGFDLLFWSLQDSDQVSQTVSQWQEMLSAEQPFSF